MTTETRELVQLASRGDGASLRELLQRFLPELRAFIRLKTGAHLRAKESCSDLVQSVCREVLEDLESIEYRGERAFKQWLFTRSLRKIQDRDRFHRRMKRDAAREEPDAFDEQLATGYQRLLTPSRAAIRQEEIAILEAAFDRMPEDYRDVITYARLLGMDHNEIGERMSKSPGAVRVLLHRAIARLGTLLGRAS